MSSPAALPIGVVVPTRNSREFLARHLAAMEQWLPLVAEVVVVDSESHDGTVELLRERLRHPNTRFLSHPPGLYESWNFGIRQLQSEFTCVSTMGDTLPPQTLQELAALAQRESADVVISPPTFIGRGAARMERRWPLHAIIKRWNLTVPCALSQLEAFLLSALHAPAGILGSSASNLYRTAVLQRHPFPTTYRRNGDTGWALENAFRTRMILAPLLRSEFLLHEPTDAPAVQRRAPVRPALYELARRVFREHLQTIPAPSAAAELADALEAFWNEMLASSAAGERHRDLRERPWPWLLNPAAMQARWQRFNHRRRGIRLRQEILARLDARRANRSSPTP